MGLPLKKIILLKISVRMKRAAMAMVLTLPRFVMPMRIQTMISAPMTRHHTQWPVEKMPLAARAPS